jgi:hypothetical protein
MEATMKTKIAVALCVCAGLFAVSPAALADETQNKDGKGYAYNFSDDSLLGKDMVGNTPTIHVRPKAAKGLLHRPRIQFVQEMLKSVENL